MLEPIVMSRPSVVALAASMWGISSLWRGPLAKEYPSLTIVRPSLIAADRAVVRPGEVAGLWVARALGPLIPRRYRPVPAGRIARALLEAAVQGQPGEQIVESERL